MDHPGVRRGADCLRPLSAHAREYYRERVHEQLRLLEAEVIADELMREGDVQVEIPLGSAEITPQTEEFTPLREARAPSRDDYDPHPS